MKPMGPERIEVRAIRIDGQDIVEGRTEREAIDRAIAAGLIAKRQVFEKNDDGEDRIETGYLTSHGRLVRGKEAICIAREAGQLRRNSQWNYEPGVVPIKTKRYWGNFSEAHLKGLKGKANLAEPPSATVGAIVGAGGAEELRIICRAIKYGTEETYGGRVETVEGGERVSPVERFSANGRYYQGGQPAHVIEGYTLSDDSFITRDEASERFADADIGPEHRSARSEECARTDPEGPQCA